MRDLPRPLGRYILQERLGRGGMAEVFRATIAGPAGFQRQVAVKCILPEFGQDALFAKMIADEARIVSHLAHPNVVQVIDTGEVDGQCFIAFELVDGTDLFRLLQHVYSRGLPMPPEFALYIVAEVAAGLDHAHARRDGQGRPLRIVHRDVSPQNVLVSWLGEVKLGDFGIARATQRSSETQAGTIKGKVFYMSPEQARGERVDQRSDLYSAGILLYELLCTQPMYDEDDPLKLLDTVAAGKWAWPADAVLRIPAPLRELVTRALGANPDSRFQTGRHMREAILSALAACGLHADRDSFGAWVRAEHQRPGDRPPIGDRAEKLRWHSSHRLHLPDPPARPGDNESTQLHDAAPGPAEIDPTRKLPALPVSSARVPEGWQPPPPRPVPPLAPSGPTPASPRLVLAATVVWLLALVFGTVAALLSRG